MTFGDQLARIVLQVLSVVILARLLAPHDYGLVAMVMAVVGVADIFRDFGLSAAAVQAKTLSRAQRDNLFWINTGMGLVLAALVALGAPLVAAVFDRHELVALTRVLAISFVLNGLATQYRADLNRRLKFSSLALADVLAGVIGLSAGVVSAVLGAGYWSLAILQLTQISSMLAIVVISAGWRPGLPDREAPMGPLVRFGWHLVGSQLIGYVGNNADTVIIGLRFGPGQLGLYNRAFQLLMTPLGQLRGPTTTVALPVLSRLRGNPSSYQAFVVRGQLALGYGLVVGLGLVAGAAQPVTDVFLGDQWQSAVPLLRLLAAVGALQTLAYVGYWVYLSRGLTAQLRRYTMVTTAMKVLCVFVGSQWGVEGVATGFLIAAALEWPLSIWWLSRLTPFPAAALTKGALRILTMAVAVGVAAYAVSHATVDLSAGLTLILAALAAVAAGCLLALVVPAFRRDALQVLDVVRRAKARA